MQHWKCVKHLRQAHPHQKYHQCKADPDTKHMRHRTAKSKVCAGSHKHQVIGPWSDGADKGKPGQGKEDFITHGAIKNESTVHVLAFSRVYPLILQYMMKIDAINAHILRMLSDDGRVSNIDLAERVGLSPSACLRRVQELERSGVITGYRAVVNPLKIGRGFTAYITVGLNDHTKASQEAFERAISRSPEVRECHNITGSVEYLLRVEAEDLAAYKVFHTEILGTLPQVHAITSYVVMGSPKDERA